ncbi:hypothetical protein UFOVP410_73 [uncultured Caudovirales phage]|uniref:Uncharacterized protein n=1 Tax=uncultured Caudovirales phage TaxID=2100421 RepID=A0A6J5M3A4_9CAUD|nr:hypothetical protein UFOVP410_73 [uncultured Caudovirales phage]
MKNFKQFLSEAKSFTKDQAKEIGDSLSVDWKKYDLEQFRRGLEVESEHDDGSELDVVGSKKDLGKIVLAHLKELPDYYTRLKKMEEDAPANSVGTGAGVAGLVEPLIPLTFVKRKKIEN